MREAAESLDMKPGPFVRDAAARAAAEELDLDEARLTPELVDLFKRTFRAAHLLALLKHEELERTGKAEDFEKAAEAARIAQDRTLGLGDEDAEE